MVTSNWRSTGSLEEYLRRQNLVAIADIDTRKLTRILRNKGAQNGCLIAGTEIDDDEAIARARAFPGLKGVDLAQVVTTKSAFAWSDGVWRLSTSRHDAASESEWRVVAYDFGVKHNILRLLAARGCALEVVPAQTPAHVVLEKQPDVVFLSNGPGDPEPCDYAIESIREIVESGLPTFGICLGHQLLGLACGAKTLKMKFGHHGANHPVEALATGQVMITSQNHGFAIDENSLPDHLEPTHRSLFDGSLQGIHHKLKPAFGFQGHPEASPGPHDVQPLFDHFVDLIRERNNGRG
jgi:carbamoyl-phosphate synthase small subunit